MNKRTALNVHIKRNGNAHLVFVDQRVIGEIMDGWFVQKTTSRHIFRTLNSKGIEYDVFNRLCHENVEGWRIIFTDTAQILSIQFDLIPYHSILNPPHSAGYQYHVKLQHFEVDQDVLQKSLL